ncbi:MAG TPA: hypothetical protein VIU44_18540 [Gaiellaceae bacterium]
MGFANFDFRHPDYLPVYQVRIGAAARVIDAPAQDRELLLAYYRDRGGDGIADFIEDWGMTFDPRNAERGIPSAVPFILFPKQREYVCTVYRKWREGRPLLVEKSRDGGISWLNIAIACAICILHPGIVIGFGSRKTEYVDKVDEPKSLFWKARFFMRHLPPALNGGWREAIDAPYMRMKFPRTGSYMNGEGGNDIGRGDRTSIYFVDEAAHLPRPMMVEASLSQTTNCRIDVSSVNGPTNVFAKKRHGGKVEVFIWDWRDDPRKDDAWYQKQCDELDPIVVAQEIDRDYNASVEGVLIPAAWVKASFDALDRLGLVAQGDLAVGFDVADEGKDKLAVVGGRGVEVSICEEWSGKDADIFRSTEKVFDICDTAEDGPVRKVRYDADGLGAGVKGDARVINARRTEKVDFEAYRGSSEVLNPEREDVPGRKNADYFGNRKAQEWWSLRTRFLKTFRWVVQKKPCDPSEIISINTKTCKKYLELAAEISQPTFRTKDDGKMIVEKQPGNDRTERMPSPNKADALVIRNARSAGGGGIKVGAEALAKARAARGGVRFPRVR